MNQNEKEYQDSRRQFNYDVRREANKWEYWLHERHLFVPAAILVALLSLLFILFVWYWFAPEPRCGLDAPVNDTCELQVEHGA